MASPLSPDNPSAPPQHNQPTSPTPTPEEWAPGRKEDCPSEAAEEECKGIAKFLDDVDSYTPTIPEAIIQQYLQLGGAACEDPRILKLVALATDKFLAEVVKEAKENGELRVGEKRGAPPLSMQVFSKVK
mmetsp:Transcript_8157/g.18612  ORF Transcript_8157/g.18612 Transcript_8157/m.18612 type:complete len:130 (+) Transcript_8157:60-449(+)